VLYYCPSHLNIVGYSDDEWASNLTDYYTFVGDNLAT